MNDYLCMYIDLTVATPFEKAEKYREWWIQQHYLILTQFAVSIFFGLNWLSPYIICEKWVAHLSFIHKKGNFAWTKKNSQEGITNFTCSMWCSVLLNCKEKSESTWSLCGAWDVRHIFKWMCVEMKAIATSKKTPTHPGVTLWFGCEFSPRTVWREGSWWFINLIYEK